MNNGRPRSDNQLVQGLNIENRKLRQVIEQMSQQQNQAEFLEELTCAAVTGFASRPGLTPEEIADLANDTAEKVLTSFIRKVMSAQDEVAEQTDKAAAKTADSVEQTLAAADKFQQDHTRPPGAKIELIL